MNQKLMYRIFGILSFVVALITYALTVQPTVPFWDCGEFSSASMWQQVPHPPGAPLFLMVAKVVQTIIPFGDIGWRINLVSVFASAFTIWLLYLITVKVIFNFKKESELSSGEHFAVYGSALVGALAFTFSDTFWFNAVESEVYAASQLFVAIITYLMMRWNEKADEVGSEKYLLLIAYLMGLSTGVHLLALLTLFSIALVVYFRKYTFSVKSLLTMGIISVVVFFVVYPGIVKYIPALLGGHFPMKNELQEYVFDSDFMPFIAIGIMLLAVWGFYWGYKNDKPIVKLSTLAFLLMVFGYTTYTQILLRSHSNSPMNENEPKNFVKLTSYLGREQYGDQKMWPRRTDFQDQEKIQIYNKQNANGEYEYGEWVAPVGKSVTGKDGRDYSVPSFEDVNVKGELNYMFKWQIGHMYVRYFLWNFVGRASDIQDSPEAFIKTKDAELFNYKSGQADQFPVRFFALPLLFGLFGLFFHFWKDPKMALAQLIIFLLMGVLATLQQNQQNPQPRERDYFYTGSFFVFAMWIGLGVYGLIDWLVKRQEKVAISSAIVFVSLILVPVNMALGGWKIHSRAGNYLPFDYSYNILQSVEQDAILFTNGDNDTFPVWWLQDVAGVRRDVRIVNLSLGNTLWYIHQLKHREPWGAKKIPLTFKDETLTCAEDDPRALRYGLAPSEKITIPVSQDILRKYTNDEEYIKNGKMEFTFAGKMRSEEEKDEKGNQLYLTMVHNKLVKDIIMQTKFERPVYFSITAGTDVYSGLDRFLRAEGMAMKVCPVPAELLKGGKTNSDVMEKCLMQADNSDNYSLTQKYGFKFRNLNTTNVYYDEVHRRLMGSYRQLYFRYALYTLENQKDNKKAVRILDEMNKNISIEAFPMYQDEELQVAMLFRQAKAYDKAKQFANMALKTCNEIINNKVLRDNSRWRIPSIEEEILGVSQSGIYRTAAEAYTILGKPDDAKAILNTFLDLCIGYISSPDGAQYRNYIQRSIGSIIGQIYSIDDDQISSLVEKGKKDEAIAKANQIIAGYKNDPRFAQVVLMLQQKVIQISGKQPELLDSAATDTAKVAQVAPN